ncbi:winged helix-turn-helix domain-containing protein [Sphingosinithalassobacter sp. LHW66-3]|uniref:winged helix-turn-helix domain-containing protein n=1 Tax=Sphingosinithalassobacter sp. LHW66-3 TaxID=3424718 RepID=UPI003D6BAD3F
MAAARLKLKIQIMAGDEIALGPGKAALLEAIAATGSISAAARATGMSYRRAWLLVDTCNRCFTEPLVETVRGGGACLTAQGHALLAAYQALVARIAPAADDPDYARIAAALRSP